MQGVFVSWISMLIGVMLADVCVVCYSVNWIYGGIEEHYRVHLFSMMVDKVGHISAMWASLRF